MTEKQKKVTEELDSDDLIQDLGGCGRYQWRLNVMFHLIKSVMSFSIVCMGIISATPKWFCADDITCYNESSSVANVTTCSEKSCRVQYTGESCTEFDFKGDRASFVSEMGAANGCPLVPLYEAASGTLALAYNNKILHQDYMASLIMTIQVAGTLVGNIVAGQLGDLIGRRPPLYAATVLTFISNLIGFFSTNEIMFAVCRFFIGVGTGFFMTMKYSLLCEFTLAEWRVWVIGFPSWPIQACVLALLAWVIQDWRYLQLMIALLCVPCLFSWWWTPESFRWHLANDRTEKAKEIVEAVAKCNNKKITDIDHLMKKPKHVDKKKYTILDMIRTKSLLRILFFTSMNWAALGLVSYGIEFGVQALSGNIYFNYFLFNMVGIPSKFIALRLQNWFGRRWTTVICYLFVLVGGTVVGIVENTDASNKDSLINGFALFAYLGIATAWSPVQTMTIELIPTVVRTVGFGFLSVFGRLAAMVGPQLVYANTYIPGVLYFSCAGWCGLCIMACLCLPETKGGHLQDKLSDSKIKGVAVIDAEHGKKKDILEGQENSVTYM